MDRREMEELARLIEASENVAEACRRFGIARSVFYRWRKRAGLPAEKRRHPHARTGEAAAMVLELAFRHPEWGCDRISHYLHLHGMRMSGTSVQKLLSSRGLGTAAERARARNAADPGTMV